jgi:membrane protein YqaA with SNARE-associated domain
MEFFQTLFDWYMANLNYFTIALLMAIESTFMPLPSEVVVPFAAYKAAQGDLNVFLVILFGTIGALAGSLINYSLAFYLGRPIVYRFAESRVGKLFLLSKEKVEHAENFFIKNGKTSTFIGNSCRTGENEPPRLYAIYICGRRDLEYHPGNNRILLIRNKGSDFSIYRAYSSGIGNSFHNIPDHQDQEKQEKI